MLKIKDGKGQIIGVLKDEDTEPNIIKKKCTECDGTGWAFKNRNPPFHKCSLCE